MRVPPWTLLAAAALAAVGADGQIFCMTDQDCKDAGVVGSDGRKFGKDVPCVDFDKLYHNVGDVAAYQKAALREKEIATPAAVNNLVFDSKATSSAKAVYAVANANGNTAKVYRAGLAGSNLAFVQVRAHLEPVQGVYMVPAVAGNDRQAEMVVVQSGTAQAQTLSFFALQGNQLQALPGRTYKINWANGGAMVLDGDDNTALQLKAGGKSYRAVSVRRGDKGNIEVLFFYGGRSGMYKVVAVLGNANTLSGWGKVLLDGTSPIISINTWTEHAAATPECVFDLKLPTQNSNSMKVTLRCTEAKETGTYAGFTNAFKACAVGGGSVRMAASKVEGSKDVLYAIACGPQLYKVWAQYDSTNPNKKYVLRPLLVENLGTAPYHMEVVAFAGSERIVTLRTAANGIKKKRVLWHTARRECAPQFTIGAADRLSAAQRQTVATESGLGAALAKLDAFATRWWKHTQLTGVCSVPFDLGATPFTTHVWTGSRVLLPYKRGLAGDNRKIQAADALYGNRYHFEAVDGTEVYEYYGIKLTDMATYAEALTQGFEQACWKHIKDNFAERLKLLSVRAAANMYGHVAIERVNDPVSPDQPLASNDGARLFDFPLRVVFPWWDHEAAKTLRGLVGADGALDVNKKEVVDAIKVIRSIVAADLKVKTKTGVKELLYKTFCSREPRMEWLPGVQHFGYLLSVLKGNTLALDALSHGDLHSLAKPAYDKVTNNIENTKVIVSPAGAIEVADTLSAALATTAGTGSLAKSRRRDSDRRALDRVRAKQQCIPWASYGTPFKRKNNPVKVGWSKLTSYQGAAEFTTGASVEANTALAKTMTRLLCDDSDGLLATNSLNPHGRFASEQAMEMRWYADSSYAAQMSRGLAALSEQYDNFDGSQLQQYDEAENGNWKVLVRFNNPPVVLLVRSNTVEPVKELKPANCWKDTKVDLLQAVRSLVFTYEGWKYPVDQGKWKEEPKDVMGSSAHVVAKKCAVAGTLAVKWEWLHRVARLIAGRGTTREGTGDQKKNFVLGTAEANTEMLTYEYAFDKASSWMFVRNNNLPASAYGGVYDVLKYKTVKANADDADTKSNANRYKLKVGTAIPARFGGGGQPLAKTLDYTVTWVMGAVNKKMMKKTVSLFRATQPSLLANAVAFTAIDMYDVTDPSVKQSVSFNTQVMQLTGKKKKNAREAAALGRAADVAQVGAVALDVVNNDTAAVALGLAELTNWVPLADKAVETALLSALRVHAPTLPEAGGAAMQGKTPLQVGGVVVTCDVHALLYAQDDGTVDYALQVVPPSDVQLLGAGVATGCRLVQEQYGGEATNVRFAGTVDLGPLFGFLSGVQFPSLGKLELSGQFYGQQVLKWLTLDANVDLLAKLVVTDPAVPAELPLVDAGLRVDLLLKDATQGVRAKASVRRRPLFEKAGVTTEVFGLLEVAGQVSWDSGKQKLAVTVAGGQDEEGSAVFRLTVGKHAGLFGLPFALDYATLDVAVEGSSVAVAVEGEVAPDNMNVTLGFAGTYRAEGVTLTASVRSLSLADTVALAQHVGASTGTADASNSVDAAPAMWDAKPFTLEAAAVTLSKKGVEVAASATLFGGEVALVAKVSAKAVSFTATAEELTFPSAGVTLQAASLSFAFGKNVAPGVSVSADLYFGNGLVASLAGCYGSATGGDYYLSAKATASPAVGLDTLMSDVAATFAALTGVRYALPDAHAGFSAVAVAELSVSLSGGAGTGSNGVCSGPARPDGLSDGFALSATGALQGVGFTLQFAHDNTKGEMSFHGAVKGVRLGAATVDLQLGYTLSVSASTLAAKVDVAVAGTTLTLGGDYNSASDYCVWLAKSGKAVNLAHLLTLHADKVAAKGSSQLAAPAVVPQFSIGDVTLSLCSAADEVRGLPAGFSVSGVAMLFGAKVQLQAVLEADRVVFSGQTLTGEVLKVGRGGLSVSSASVAFEVNRAGTDAEKAKHAVTFTAVTSLGATTIQLSDGTATPALRVRYDAPGAAGVGFDAALAFLSDLDGQAAGQQALTQVAAQLAHIRLRWAEAVVPHAGALTFRVGLGFVGADVTAQLAVVWGKSVGVTVSAQAGKTVALGSVLGGAAPAKVHPGAMSDGVTAHYSNSSGFTDFTVALSVTRSGSGSGTFALDVAGRPALGVDTPAKSGFVDALKDFINEAELQVAIRVPFGASVADKDVTLQLGVRRGRQQLGAKGNLWIEGFAGGGPGGDAALGQPGVDGTTLKPDGKGVEFFVGLTLAKPSVDLVVYVPLKACVRNCKGAQTDKQWIWFADSLEVTVSAQKASVKNNLVMQGGWWKVLGVEWLHLRSALFALVMDLKSPGAPGSLEIGGNMCLGEQVDCQVFPTPDKNKAINVYAYTSINLAVPEESWFIVLVNELTFGGLFRVLKFDYHKLPQPVLDSGLLARKTCTIPKTHDYTNAPVFDPDCYVQVSNNPTPCPPSGACPDQKVTVPGGTLVVQKGFVVRGVLDIFDWKLAVDIEISKKFIKISMTMLGPLAFKLKDGANEVELLTIGKTYDAKAKKLTGGAHMDLQAGTDPSTGKEVAQMQFVAAFEMKTLQAYGSLLLDVNSKDFTFDTGVSLFGGAFHPRVEAKWDWKGTYLHFSIEDLSFAGVVVVTSFEYEQRMAAGKVSGKFVAKVAVLGLLRIGAELEYSFGSPTSTLAFKLTETSALSVAVSGNATIATPLRNSRFTLAVKVSIDVAALRDAVVRAIVEVGKALQSAWHAVEDGVKKLEKQIGDVIKKGWKSFETGVSDVFNLLFGPGAGRQLVAAFGKAVEWGKKLAKGVKTFLVDTFTNKKDVRIITLRDPADEYGCLKQQRVWKDCVNIWPLRKVCFPDHSGAFTDPVCLKRAVQAATEAKKMKGKRDEKDAVRVASRGANFGTDAVHNKTAQVTTNPGKLFANEYTPFVPPDVGAPDGELTQGTYKGKVSAKGARELRKSAGSDGTLFDSSTAPTLLGIGVDVNFNPSDRDRATAKVAGQLSTKAQTRQEGRSVALDKASGQSTVRPTLRFRAAGDAKVAVGCAAFNAATFSPPQPTFKTVNPSCKGDTRVGLAGQIVEASCAGTVYTNRYIGHDACGYVSDALTQTVTVTPQTAIAFKPYPFDACYISGLCNTDPIHTHGKPKLEACHPHTVDYTDSKHKKAVRDGNVKSCWHFTRTWTAEMTYTQDGTPDGASCGATLKVTQAQPIYVCDGDVLSTVRLLGSASDTLWLVGSASATPPQIGGGTPGTPVGPVGGSVPLGLIWRFGNPIGWWYVEQTTDMSLAGGAEGTWEETTISPTKRVFRHIRGNCYLGVQSMHVPSSHSPWNAAYSILSWNQESNNFFVKAWVRWQPDVLTCLAQPTVWDTTYQPDTKTFLLSVREGNDALHVAPLVGPALYKINAKTTTSVFAGTRRTATDPAQLHGLARANFGSNSVVLPWLKVAVVARITHLKPPALAVKTSPPVSCSELSDAHFATPTLDLDARCATEPMPVPQLESEADVVTCFTTNVTRVWTATDACQQTGRLTQIVPVAAAAPVFAYVPGDVVLSDADAAVREAVAARGTGALPGAALLPGGAAREGDHCGVAVAVGSADGAVVALANGCRRVARTWTAAYRVPAGCAHESVPTPTQQTQHITVCPESLFEAVTLQVAAAASAEYLEPQPAHHGTEVDVVRKQMLGMYWRRVSTDGGQTWHYFDPTRRCYLQAVGDGAGGAALLRCGDAAQAWTAHKALLTIVGLVIPADAVEVALLRVAVGGKTWSLVCTPQTPTCTVQLGQHDVYLAVVRQAVLQVADADVTCSAYGSVIGSDTREGLEALAAGNTVVPRPTFKATTGCAARVVLVAWAVEHQPCGRKEVRLTWRGQEAVTGGMSLQTGIGTNCQRSTEERVQTIRVRPDVPAFAHVPRDVVVADAAGALRAWQSIDPARLPGGAAHVAAVCGPRAVVQHHDTEWTQHGAGTCWTMRRTWTAHLELDAKCGDSVHAAVEPVQRVTLCSSGGAGVPEVTFAAAGGAPVLRVGEKNNVDGLERVVSLNSSGAAAVWVEHAVTATESYFHNHQHGCFLNFATHCKGYSAKQPTCSGPQALVAACAAEPRLWKKVAVVGAAEMVGAPKGTSFHYLVTGADAGVVGPTGFVLATHKADATLLEALPASLGTLGELAAAGGQYFRMAAVGVFGGTDLSAKPKGCATDGDCGAAWFCRSVDTGAAAAVGAVVLPAPGSAACGATRVVLGESCVGREGCCATGSVCTAVNGYATCQFVGRAGCSQFAGVGESCAGAAAGCCTPGMHCVVTDAQAGTAVCKVSTCSASRRVCVRRSSVGQSCGAGAAAGGCGEQRCADGLVCDAKAKTCAAPVADTTAFSAVAVEQVSAQRQMTEPSVARLAGGQTVFVWAHHGAQGGASAGVFGQLYSHAFAPVGVEFQVSADGAAGTPDQPQVAALYGGGFVAVWASTDAGGTVYAQVFTAGGERGGGVISVATGVAAALTAAAPQPQVAGFADRSGFVVSWQQQQQQVVFAEFSENGAAVRTASGTASTGNVAVATFQHSLGFALAHTGSNGEALVQLFDGKAAAVATRAVCGGAAGAAVWDMAKYPHDHRLAVLCAAGGWVSLEILGGDGEVVVAAAAIDEVGRGRARVAVLSDATVAVVWAGPQGVVARHFSAAADVAPLGGVIAVHSGAATRPAVAALRDGGFVAAFTTAAGAIGASFLYHADRLPTVGEAAGSVDSFLVGVDGLTLVHDDALDMVRMLPHSASRGVWTLHAVVGGTAVYNAKKDCYLSVKTLPPQQCLGGYCDIATCTPRGSAALLQTRPHLWTLVDVAPAVPGVRGRTVRLVNAERHVDVYTAAAAAAYGNPLAEPRFVALVAGGSVADGRNVLVIDVVANKDAL